MLPILISESATRPRCTLDTKGGPSGPQALPIQPWTWSCLPKVVDLFLRSPGSSECPKSRADWKPAVATSFLHPSQNSSQNATPWPLNPVCAPLLLRQCVDPVRMFTYGVLTWLAFSAAPVGEPWWAATSGGSRRLTTLAERLPHPYSKARGRSSHPAATSPWQPPSSCAFGGSERNIDLQGFWLTGRRRPGGGNLEGGGGKRTPLPHNSRTLPLALAFARCWRLRQERVSPHS